MKFYIALFLTILFAIMVTACGDNAERVCQDNDPKADPSGLWNMTENWGSGNCGLTDPDNLTFTLLYAGPNVYDLVSMTGLVDPTIDGGRVDCNGVTLTITIADHRVDFRNTTIEAAVDLEGDITGTGVMAMYTGSGSCIQDFTITGKLN